jgi:amino acid adenylation domain-containing protein/non-ribosomal peptide synthase protein (TIGR01720 family)
MHHPFNLPEVDLGEIPEADRTAQVKRLIDRPEILFTDPTNELPLFTCLYKVSTSSHYLIISLPALCADGVTMAKLAYILVKNFLGVEGDNLPVAPALQYVDIADWQNDLLESPETAKGRSYWGKQIASDNPLVSFPWHKQDQRGVQKKLKSLQFGLRTTLIEALRARASSEGLTIPDIFLACWFVLLRRYSDNQDVVARVAYDGRSVPGLEHSLGPLTRFLPLQANIELDRSLGEVARKISLIYRETAEWQDYFDGEEIYINNTGNSDHISPFCFECQHYQGEYMVGNTRFAIIRCYSCIDWFRLKLACALDDKTASIELHYDSQFFSCSQAERFGGQWQKVLQSFIDRPEDRVGDIDIVGDWERQLLLNDWNDTAASYPSHKCLPELLAEQASVIPDRIAVVFDEQQVSYEWLQRCSNHLADYLQWRGVSREKLVAIHMSRSIEAMVAILGVLGAGGAYLPLDPDSPQQRLKLVMDDAQPALVLSHTKYGPGLVGDGVEIISLDAEWKHITNRNLTNVDRRVDSENICYVIYTSGSTGKPKGVTLTHRGLINYLSWCLKAYPVTKGTGSPVHTPLVFDLTLTSLFPPLLAGRTVTLLNEENGISSLAEAFCRQEGFSLVKLTPAHLSLLEELCDGAEVVGATKAIIIGGEPLRSDILSYWRDQAPNTMLINEYGPTEAVVGCCAYEIPAESRLSPGIPIGRPISNVKIYLLDPLGQLVPIGLPGEIYVSGDGLARGYLNRPDLTAERFIPSPYDSRTGARMYKTGDLSRRLPDGNLEFLGRNDQQIKLRGHRIELGEIEAVLGTHPGIQGVAVVAIEGPYDRQRIVAYVVPHAQQAIGVRHHLGLKTRERSGNHNTYDLLSDYSDTTTVLKESNRGEDKWGSPDELIQDILGYLRTQLPDYMIPEQVVLLDAMPLTSNHKIDRRALPIPEKFCDHSVRNYIPPSTQVEQLLAKIWQEVLGRERIGVNESFFALGGDSIMSIQVIAKASQAGLQLTPRQFFRHQTIKELAAVANAESVMWTKTKTSGEGIPLTPIQHWFFEQSLSDYNHYNQSVLLEICDELDVTALDQAIRVMIASHDAFHLRFHLEDGRWRQSLVSAMDEPPLSHVDLSELIGGNQGSFIKRIANDVQKSLNLSGGPIFRASLIQLAGKPEWRLLFIIHHLAVDGVSWRILLEELERLYQQFRLKKDGEHLAAGGSFRDWAIQLRQYAGRGAGHPELEFWASAERKNISPLTLDHADGENTQESCRIVSVSLSEGETGKLLQEACYNLQASIEEVLLTALLLAVARWSGRSSLLLDLERHGRDSGIGRIDISRTVGWFTTIVPVLLTTDCLADPIATLKQVKMQMRAIPNRGAHYGILRYLSNGSDVVETLKMSPQPQICFNYLGQFDQVFSSVSPFRLAKEAKGNDISLKAKRRYLLEWIGWVSAKQMMFDCRYSENQFRRLTIEGMMYTFVQALKDLITRQRSTNSSYSTNKVSGTDLARRFLDKLMRGGFEIEDVYPLSPLQEGILFHSLKQPEVGAYVTQNHFVFSGNLEITALQESWQKVVDLHSALRTAFIWEESDDPHQVVVKHVLVPWVYEDWTSLDSEEQKLRLERLLKDDWEAGFNLDRPPLMRLTLVRKGSDAYEFIWTYHHILIDGWSMGLLLKDVFACYKSIVQNRHWAPLTPRPYRDYIAWLSERDDPMAQKYWIGALKEFHRPTPLGMCHSSGGRQLRRTGYLEEGRQLGDALKSDLLQLARREQITLNTLVQGAWALLLHHYSGDNQVMFGVTLAGRPTDLNGSDSMIGLFINTLPLRVSVPVSEAASPWLRWIQRQSAELIQYQYSSLTALRGQSSYRHEAPLFESIVVFENYPVDSSLQKVNEIISVQNARGRVRTHYPITIRAAPNKRFTLEILFDEGRVGVDTIRSLLSHFEQLFRHFVKHPDDSLSQILKSLTDADRQRHSAMEMEFNKERRRQLRVAKRRSVGLKKPES